MSPPRSLSELEDVSDTTSSLGSGDWTDLSSAHPDDVSDNGSVDGSEQPRPVIADIGGSEVWTTADALSSSSASVYASIHPVESDGESDKSVRPFDPFREHDPLQLILPDPLERSDSTVAADLLSFSDDAVLATTPAAIVSLAGAHPSIAQRTAVVTDILVAIARATHSSVVRPDYYNFTTLSGLPTRVTNNNAPTNEISVHVRDHISDPLTNSVDNTPSILVIFTSDAQESTVPSVSGHSILIPVVLSESRPVVLFDERDAPDETSVDIEELVRQLSNLYTFERDSVATTQTAIEDEPVHEPVKTVEPVLKIDEPVLQPVDSDVRTTDIDDVQSLDDSDAKSLVDDTLRPDSDIDEKPRKPLARKRLPLDRIVGPERADAFRKFHANMGPGLTAACALAVFLSLVLGTNHLIQSSSKNALPIRIQTMSHGMSTVPVEPSVTSTSLSTNLPHTSLALKSPHTSLALKSTHTSLATKSPHTSLAVKSQHTSVAVRSSTTTSLAVKSQHTNLSVHPESCYSASASASTSTSTSLSATLASTSLSTTTPAPTATPDTKANILKEAAEEIGNAIERIERVIGLDLRRNTEAALKVIDSVRKSSAVCKASDKVEAVIEAVNRANEAIKAASGVDTAETLKSAKGEIHGRHQVARRTAQRQLASLKRGVESLVWGEEDVKGKGKAKDEPVNDKVKAKAKSKETPRPGREKWHTSKDHRFSTERITKKDKTSEKSKKTFPSREEQEKARTAGRGKRPTAKDKRHMDLDEEPAWMWDAEFAYELGYGPRAVVEEVREFFAF